MLKMNLINCSSLKSLVASEVHQDIAISCLLQGEYKVVPICSVLSLLINITITFSVKVNPSMSKLESSEDTPF